MLLEMYRLKIKSKLFAIMAFLSFQNINAQTIGSWNQSTIKTSTNSAVAIGTATPGAWQEIEYCQNTQDAGGLRMDAMGNMEVRGDVRATKVVVNARWWPDFVFDKNYPLMAIDTLEQYITTNGHLPGIPSQDSVISNGQDIGEVQKLQQQKIEELTLYIIQQQKLIDEMMIKMNALAANSNKKN